VRILWTRIASDQLKAAIDFISQDNESAAENQLRIIRLAVEQLVHFPEMGRPGRVDGTRELVIQSTPYLVAYRLKVRRCVSLPYSTVLAGGPLIFISWKSYVKIDF
jgi:toxin ParE1/3/4